jgi:nitroreductase
VPEKTLRAIFELAQKAASNCNTQPWKSYVVSGNSCDALRKDLYQAASEDTPPNPYFGSIPVFHDEYKERQFECALAMYGSMGITREDKSGRRHAMLRNFQLFDAPHAVFITMPTNVNINSAIDVGSYMQSLMLVMTANGIASCAQGALALYPDIVRKYADIPHEEGVLVGISFGYEQIGAPVNKTITTRAGIDEVVHFYS